jgi:hypothetical protein
MRTNPAAVQPRALRQTRATARLSLSAPSSLLATGSSVATVETLDDQLRFEDMGAPDLPRPLTRLAALGSLSPLRLAIDLGRC